MCTQPWAPQATFHTPIHLQSKEITDLSQRSGWRHFLFLLFLSCWPSPTPRELSSCSTHTEEMIPLLSDPPLLLLFFCSNHWVLVKGERALPGLPHKGQKEALNVTLRQEPFGSEKLQHALGCEVARYKHADVELKSDLMRKRKFLS